jgi:hypothetical protein
MVNIPEKLNARFKAFLHESKLSVTLHNYDRKWLRYDLDYCNKCQLPLLSSGSLPHFLNKLREKKQTGFQQEQAGEAVSLKSKARCGFGHRCQTRV